MNYLDLLPVDVMKIIYRKVHDAQIRWDSKPPLGRPGISLLFIIAAAY